MPSARPHHHEERLRIRAFGPIAAADITVRPLTVFIGPQATGKSLTAQLLYFMRGLEELVGPKSTEPPQVAQEDSLRDLLTSWLDPTMVDLALSSGSLMQWTPGSTHAKPAEYRLSAQGQDSDDLDVDLELKANPALRKRIRQAQVTHEPPAVIDEQQIYVPAGRLLCSLVKPALGLSLLARNRLSWPGYLSTFYEKLGAAIEQLPTLPTRLRASDRESVEAHIATKSQSSLRGRLSRRQRDEVQLSTEDRHHQGLVVTNLIGGGFASGQLETWPLWTLLQAHLPSDQIKRIFIEEPEAHLHPTAQRDTVEALVTLLRHRFRFVLTTHSPYVLYALNNALLAGRVLRDGKPLPVGFPADFSLAPQDISAYRFTHDGQVVSLFDEETGLLDAAELDDPAAALSAEFSDLQDAFYRDKP